MMFTDENSGFPPHALNNWKSKIIKLNLQICTLVIVNLNNVCYVGYKRHFVENKSKRMGGGIMWGK
jgi:hypothetical protein